MVGRELNHELRKFAHSFSIIPFIKLGGAAHLLMDVSNNSGSLELNPPISTVVNPAIIFGIFVCWITNEHIIPDSLCQIICRGISLRVPWFNKR